MSKRGRGARTQVSMSSRARLLQMAVVVLLVGAAAGLLVRRSQSGAGAGDASGGGFKEVGRNGPVFTVSVPPARVADEAFLMRIAEQISAREVQAGGSGQVSVMIWPDSVTVPKEPPTTELDASMKTQAAGIFINPKMNIKHLIRFRDGQTISERDFGAETKR